MLKLSDLLKSIVSDVKNYESVNIKSMTNDSREVVGGALFLAYSGFHVDGRNYIQDAIDRGAAAICYDPDNYNLLGKYSVPLIPIENLKIKIM